MDGGWRTGDNLYGSKKLTITRSNACQYLSTREAQRTYPVRFFEEHSLHRAVICPSLFVGVWKAYPR